MPIITYPLNGIEYDAHDAETYLSTRTSGVFSSDNHFALTVSGSRQITISSGLAWINNGDFTGKSVVMTAPEALEIPVADGALNRIDLVVLRFDASENETVLAIKSGVPSTVPTAPTASKESELYELGLYLISVPAGSTSVVDSDISSVILDETYCGIMRDGVTGIPTAQIQKQAEDLISEIKSNLGEIATASATVNNSVGVPQASVVLTKSADGKINLLFDFKNLKGEQGVAGAKGDKGEQGVAGANGAAGYTPVKGKDYYTDADKAEMVNLVLAALPMWDGGNY